MPKVDIRSYRAAGTRVSDDIGTSLSAAESLERLNSLYSNCPTDSLRRGVIIFGSRCLGLT